MLLKTLNAHFVGYKIGKGKHVDYQHFSFSHNVFKKSFFHWTSGGFIIFTHNNILDSSNLQALNKEKLKICFRRV